MIPPAIVDTNVVIAGLLTARSDSPVARILDGMLVGAFQFAVSEALLAEYRTVLGRPALRKAHGLNDAEQEDLLVELTQHAIVLMPVAAPPAPDPGDQLLWELLAARNDLCLITGDKRLLEDQAMQPRVITPQAYLQIPPHS